MKTTLDGFCPPFSLKNKTPPPFERMGARGRLGREGAELVSIRTDALIICILKNPPPQKINNDFLNCFYAGARDSTMRGGGASALGTAKKKSVELGLTTCPESQVHGKMHPFMVFLVRGEVEKQNPPPLRFAIGKSCLVVVVVVL